MSDSSAASCCSMPAHATVSADGRVDLLATSGDHVECPVMGGTVVPAQAEAAGLFRDYDGTRYYFCCAGCAPRFDADPARYAAAA
ncbi:YHS domain-containing protein [Microbacterium sp. GXS0129]|jgi:YHS domain-containing protein|uniref:YHS domain-containing protein n=1 Tax=Microbacterium sp. GXS0129 TaxID=3377836 RepID=UPI00383B0E4F